MRIRLVDPESLSSAGFLLADSAYMNFKEGSNRNRATGELVLHNGWISLDYDDDGFLVGMEFFKGDPFAQSQLNPPELLQPKNPLKG